MSHEELAHDRLRLRQWLCGDAAGFSRRDLLKLTAAVGVLGGTTAAAAAPGDNTLGCLFDAVVRHPVTVSD